MTKTQFYMARRGPTIAAADFPARWLQHFGLFKGYKLKTPYTSGRYVLVDHDLSDENTDTPPYDALAISTLDDLEAVWAMAKAYPEFLKVMKDDEEIAFGGDVDPRTCYGDRTELVKGDRSDFAIILVRQRRPEISREEFNDAWREHVDQIMASPALRGKISYAAHTEITLFRLPDYEFDGMTELWVDSYDTLRAGIKTVLDMVDEEAKFVITSRSRTMATRVLPR